MQAESTGGQPEWLQPPAEQEGLGRYVQTVRERLPLIGLVVAAALAMAALYLLTASKVYEAEADLLITPASSEDPVLSSLGALRESSDPTRDVETAARLVTTVDVAERVDAELGLDAEPQELLEDVTAEPVAQSNIVAVTARAGTPEEAQALANAFAAATVADRTEKLHEAIRERLPALRARADVGGPGLGAESVAAQIARHEVLLAGNDPTIRVETEASLPTDAVSPRPALTLAGALLAGLVLGIGAAFAIQGLDPVLRREEQLRNRYRLPILARIPKEVGRGDDPLAPTSLSAATLESYRTLRASVSAARRRRGTSESLLVTGSSPSEGKTTTAINLACSLALAGNRVILIEADLRRPAIAKTLGISVEQGVVNVLLENVALEDALITTRTFGPGLELLLADYEGGWITELFSLPAAERLMDDAKRLADYVIVDSPPLTSVVDALPLARNADDVLIVTRLGRSRLDRLHELGEMLAANDLRPLGFAVLGVTNTGTRGYYLDQRGNLGDGARRLRSAKAPSV